MTTSIEDQTADAIGRVRLNRRSWLRSALCTSAALSAPAILAACAEEAETPAPSPAPEPAPEPTPEPDPAPEPGPDLAATGATFPLIVDTANQLNLARAQRLKALGATTVFRYYSYVPSNIAGKDLTPTERDAIFEAGLSVGVVFQHYNNCFDTFANDWGARDAAQALELAALNNQPQGSAIYFGVDGDFPFASMLADQIQYMRRVNETFAGSGYKIGAYGGGCALDRMRREGLAELFWLSGSTGFTGTKAFYNQRDWTMFQNAYDFRSGGSVGIDTNWANPATNGVVGQWSASGVATGDAAAARKIVQDRRFTRGGVSILAAPEEGAAALGSVRADSNVRVVAQSAEWAEVITREGGDGVSVRGFVPTARLSSVDQFTSQAAYGICGVNQTPSSAVRNANCSAAARAFRQ